MKSTTLEISKVELEAVLHARGVLKASVFGSFARGDASHDSDLDLLVTYRSGTTLFDIINLQDELERLTGRKVDLVPEKYLSQRLAKRIRKDIKPLSSVV